LRAPNANGGAEKETTDHVLLNCEIYDEERGAAEKKSWSTGDEDEFIARRQKDNKNTMEYIEKTGRFKLEK
jgi:hypothetical protein